MSSHRSEVDLDHLNFPLSAITISNPHWNNKNQSRINSIKSDKSRMNRKDYFPVRYWKKEEIAVLELAYQGNQYADSHRQNELALQLNVSGKKICYWFKNRRAQERLAGYQFYQNPQVKEYHQGKVKQQSISRQSSNSVNRNLVGVYNNSNYSSEPHYMVSNPYRRNFGHDHPYRPRYPLQKSMTSNFLRRENPDCFKMYPTSKLVPPRYPMSNIDQQQTSLLNESVISESKTELNPSYWNEQIQDDFLDFLDEIANSFVQGNT